MINLEKIWPEWKVERLIGEGAFGRVYEISRKRFGIEERRAMKVISIPSGRAEYDKLLSEGFDEESAAGYFRSMLDVFIKEIALLSQLRGTPNIVDYDDYQVKEHTDSFGWDIYIMMELLTPLSDVLRERPFTESETVKLGMDICDALIACHNRNILHRDIKIDNIFVSDDGVYKLGDFGIARKAEHTVALYTKTGTESYMAPEVYKGEPYGKRADIYSLGIVLYRLLNYNRDPFMPGYPKTITFDDKNESMVRRMKGEAFPLPGNASDTLGRVVVKACAFSQNDRYASAAEFRYELNKCSSAAGQAGGCDTEIPITDAASAADSRSSAEAVDEKTASVFAGFGGIGAVQPPAGGNTPVVPPAPAVPAPAGPVRVPSPVNRGAVKRSPAVISISIVTIVTLAVYITAKIMTMANSTNSDLSDIGSLLQAALFLLYPLSLLIVKDRTSGLPNVILLSAMIELVVTDLVFVFVNMKIDPVYIMMVAAELLLAVGVAAAAFAKGGYLRIFGIKCSAAIFGVICSAVFMTMVVIFVAHNLITIKNSALYIVLNVSLFTSVLLMALMFALTVRSTKMLKGSDIAANKALFILSLVLAFIAAAVYIGGTAAARKVTDMTAYFTY